MLCKVPLSLGNAVDLTHILLMVTSLLLKLCGGRGVYMDSFCIWTHLLLDAYFFLLGRHVKEMVALLPVPQVGK